MSPTALRTDIFGWFEGTNPTPAHDPGPDGLCIICANVLRPEPVVTCSVAWQDGQRSYFYRAHKRCYQTVPERERDQIDHALLDRAV